MAVARARPRPRLVVSLHNDLPPTTRSAPARAGAAVARRLLGWSLRRAALVTGASADLVDLAVSSGARRTELAPVASAAVVDLLRTEPLAPTERGALLA